MLNEGNGLLRRGHRYARFSVAMAVGSDSKRGRRRAGTFQSPTSIGRKSMTFENKGLPFPAMVRHSALRSRDPCPFLQQTPLNHHAAAAARLSVPSASTILSPGKRALFASLLHASTSLDSSASLVVS